MGRLRSEWAFPQLDSEQSRYDQMGRGDDLEEQRLATHDSFEWVSFQID